MFNLTWSESTICDKTAIELISEIYNGCGKTKGCFGYPTGCIQTENCSLLAAWQPDCSEATSPIKKHHQSFRNAHHGSDKLNSLRDKRDLHEVDIDVPCHPEFDPDCDKLKHLKGGAKNIAEDDSFRNGNSP